MGDAQFGVTFFASSQRQDACGSNGLPLTPNSIRILGRSRYLKSLVHPNLAEYVEVIRGKHGEDEDKGSTLIICMKLQISTHLLERIVVVSEYYGTNLRTVLKTQKLDFRNNLEKLMTLIVEILRALVYLNDQGYVALY